MRPILAALMALLPAAAAAEEPALPFTYADFEAAVPHIDLAVCPEPLDGPGRFCRVTTHSEQLNVFAFSEDGDQPLVAFSAWPAELLVGLMD